NLADRVTSICEVAAFLRREAPELSEPFSRIVLENDLRVAFDALAEFDEREVVMAHITALLGAVDRRVVPGLTTGLRLKIELAARGLVPELVEVVREPSAGLV